MRFYTGKTVYESALDRMRYLFDEFENVIVGFSGGKDSTVTFEMALTVAKEKNKLPLKVLFLDQEAEWESVIEYVKEIMTNPDVEPLWYQMPMKETSGASHKNAYFNCWEEGVEWVRPKDELSIKENVYGTDRFGDLFTKIVEHDYKNLSTCYLSGVRAEESPARAMALTQVATYKHITWGKVLNKKINHYTFYPLYDWSYTDIWKAIHDNNWTYCKVYDYMYQYGIPLNHMRVSSIQHETAVNALFYLQEVEPDTWNAITRRIDGINSFSKMDKKEFRCPKELPYMFDTWKEYRDHLLENLILDQKQQEKYKKEFKRIDLKYDGDLINYTFVKACIGSILLNDYEMTKIGNLKKAPAVGKWLQWRVGTYDYNESAVKNQYIEDSINGTLKRD